MADKIKGRKVLIKAEDGTYSGIVHEVDSFNKKLFLNKVSMADGRKLRGLQIFFGADIRELSVVSDDDEEVNNNMAAEDEHLQSNVVSDDGCAEKPKQASSEDETSIMDKVATKDPSDSGSRLIVRKPVAPQTFLEGEDSFVKRSHVEDMQDPPEVILIDKLEDEFYSAIKFINEQRVIGLASDGENISRSGQLSLLTIGSRKYTYIFDVYKMGSECFSEGLKSVLENCSLLKVIHDCRSLSDCLYHQYQTNMFNVFDTQVADIIIDNQRRGKLPRYVNGLVPCLYEYLNLKVPQCAFQSVLSNFYKKPETWSTRPLPKELVNAIAEVWMYTKVLYLRELKITQMNHMLAEFLHGVDIYLDIFKSAGGQGTPQRGTRVPAAFNQLRKVEERRWKRYEKLDKKTDEDAKRTAFSSSSTSGKTRTSGGRRMDRNPGSRNESSMRADDDDRGDGSPDRSWTEGTEFADSYNKKHGKIIKLDDVKTPGNTPTTTTMRGDDSSGSYYASGMSPWESVRKQRSDSKEDARSEEEPEFTAAKLGKQAKPFSSNSTKNSPVIRKNDTNHAKECINMSTSTPKQNCQNERETGIIATEKDRSIEIAAAAKSLSSVAIHEPLSFVKSKKPPIDWFDSDTPSSGRSSPSSIDSDRGAAVSSTSFKPKPAVNPPKKRVLATPPNTQRIRTMSNNSSSYDDDFPTLSPVNQKNTSRRHRMEIPADSAACKDLSFDGGARGVFPGNTRTTNKTPEPRGRAKTRELNASRAASSSPAGMLAYLPKQIGTKNSFAFPSDKDLLDTNPIIETNDVERVPGQSVKLQKILTK
eukprot:gene7561-8399_t